MDTSQPLATESFSYRWLATESSSSESELHKTISHNQSLLLEDETTKNFDFDITVSKTNPSSLVHADKLFSNGLILPRSLDEPSRPGGNYDTSSSSIMASSSSSPSPLVVSSKIHHHPSSSSFRKIFQGKWSKFVPGKVLCKYVRCLVPVRESIGRGGTRVDDVNRLTWEVKSWSTNNTPQVASPIRDTFAYRSAWSDIDESSIREAILYCKRSSSGLC